MRNPVEDESPSEEGHSLVAKGILDTFISELATNEGYAEVANRLGSVIAEGKFSAPHFRTALFDDQT